jgi:hypothetical protein
MRLPDFAELTFARACAAADAIAHPPWKDENGWDYLVEFAPTDDPRSADFHEPILKAWAQVKSSEGDGLRCKVKLSNLLKSAQSHDPWFIVSTARETSGLVKIYAKHVWEDLIERTLREVRKSDIEGRRLNKRHLTLKFSDEDARNETDLLGWMRSCVSVVPNYEQEKKRIYTSAGFDDGTAVGTISFEETNPRALAREFLGLGDGLTGSGTITPTRFGMLDNSKKLTFEGKIFITPTARDKKIEIRLRGEQSSRQLLIPGHSYAIAVLAGGPWVRFSGGGVEILASASGDNTFERAWSYERHESLSDLETLGLLYSWLLSGKVDLQIWSDNAQKIATTVSANVDRRTAGQWKFFAEVVGELVRLAGPSSNLKLSVGEIVNSRELVLFYHMMTAPSVRIEFQPLAEFPTGLDRGLYYVWVDVGQITAYCVVERKLHRSNELEGGEMQLDFQGPRIIDSWIVKDADDQQRATMREDYDKAVNRLNASGIKVIELGDIRNFWHERVLRDAQRTAEGA